MTSHAPHPNERPTAGLDARQPPHADAFSLLDHRTRSRAIDRELAMPGRYLEAQDGETVRLIALDRPLIHIGRGLVSDVRLEDPHVSRRHAIVAQRGDGVRILDDRSSTGTYLNGRQVSVAELADGDVIRLGRVVLRFVELAAKRNPVPLRRIALPVRRAPTTVPPPAAA